MLKINFIILDDKKLANIFLIIKRTNARTNNLLNTTSLSQTWKKKKKLSYLTILVIFSFDIFLIVSFHGPKSHHLFSVINLVKNRQD